MKLKLLVASTVAALAFTGCAEVGADSSAQVQAVDSSDVQSPQEVATFISVVDGDTLETDLGTVRIIGIDTPERGECGYREATATIADLLSRGDEVTLERPDGQHDTDRYDRLLRYVNLDGIDIGTLQIEAGHAIARYDSTDGYPKHPQQDAYRAAQTATLDASGRVTSGACEAPPAVNPPAPAPAATPTPTPATDAASWWTEYPSCAALKRNTVGHPIGPFDVNDPDHALLYEWFANQTGNRGDGDGDGLACE